MKRLDPLTSSSLYIGTFGQPALQYYIAAFSSLASYFDVLCKEQSARTMKLCGDDAKMEDEYHTHVA